MWRRGKSRTKNARRIAQANAWRFHLDWPLQSGKSCLSLTKLITSRETQVYYTAFSKVDQCKNTIMQAPKKWSLQKADSWNIVSDTCSRSGSSFFFHYTLFPALRRFFMTAQFFSLWLASLWEIQYLLWMGSWCFFSEASLPSPGWIHLAQKACGTDHHHCWCFRR